MLAAVEDARKHGTPVTKAAITAFGQRAKNFPADAAKTEADREKLKGFGASRKWAKNLIQRNGLVSKPIHGEADSVKRRSPSQLYPFLFDFFAARPRVLYKWRNLNATEPRVRSTPLTANFLSTRYRSSLPWGQMCLEDGFNVSFTALVTVAIRSNLPIVVHLRLSSTFRTTLALKGRLLRGKDSFRASAK